MCVALTNKGAKLIALCQAAGFESPLDLISSKMSDVVCPSICMTEGCDHVTDMEKDQTEGYCEACGGTTVMSAFVLAGVV